MLVVGDAVIGNPPGRCGLLPDRVIDDPPQLRASVQRLLDLDFDTLLVGDGSCIMTGARDRLRELVETFRGVSCAPHAAPAFCEPGRLRIVSAAKHGEWATGWGGSSCVPGE